MFPFRFDKLIKSVDDKHAFYKDTLFNKRVKIDNTFKTSLEKDGWNYKSHTIDTPFDYNEFAYFHDFARDTLFNSRNFEENATSYYFNKTIVKDDIFKITIKDDKCYRLNLTGISLRIFDTGVGVLSIELENREDSQKELDDILKINEFGRRVYPQFLSTEGGTTLTDKTKKTFLADKIEITINSKKFFENFYYNTVPKNIKIADYILDLLGRNTFTSQWSDIGKNVIQPSIDDRMFTLCWYGNDKLSKALQNYKYKTEDDWYRYVFIDGKNTTVQSPQMKKKLLKKATYDRWMGYGTLYGMSRYSFVCLSASFSTLEKEKAEFITDHIGTMYYQMFTLLLAQRASILRFSDEVTSLSDIDENTLNNQISNLYKNYIRFVNKLYFREITPQDQGLEIYNQAREILRIDSDIKDLDNEIDELHRYASMLEDNLRTKKMDKLSMIGYLFLPPTLIAGIFGMNVFPSELLDKDNTWIIYSLGILISSSILTWGIFNIGKIKKKLKKKYNDTYNNSK